MADQEIKRRKPSVKYPAHIQDYIYANYKGTTPTEMTKQLNEKFGTNYTPGRIKFYYGNHKLNSGIDGRFQKGNIPFNKGKKGLSKGGVETQFKKGDIPANTKPVGYERIDLDGYTIVKVEDKGPGRHKWRPKHHLLWEEHNGPRPAGHKIFFLDQNKQNITLDNLILISDRAAAIVNKYKLLQNDPDLNKIAIQIAELKLKIIDKQPKERRRTHDKQDCTHRQTRG